MIQDDPAGDTDPAPNPDGDTTRDNSVPSAPPALRGRYNILAELGRGGMGIVYKAWDRDAKALVALKVLKPALATKEAAMERFKNEMRLARTITHRNVCRIHEFNRLQDTAYISMEYVEGRTLRQVLARTSGLRVGYGIEIARQICAGMKEAHHQGVIHRDLKPENLMITADGVVKIMDFGIAHSTKETPTGEGFPIGSPSYMSPEQAKGRPVDARSDIYSLGLILYEMFTGELPFRGDSPSALTHMQAYEAPAPPRNVEPDLPVYWEQLILRCLEKDPAARFASAEELGAALDRHAAEPSRFGETPLPEALRRWQSSDWLLVGLAIAGIAMYLPAFKRTSLAPRSEVSFDQSVLRRDARDYAEKLGSAVNGEGRVEAAYYPQYYSYLAKSLGATAALELCNDPVPYWLWEVSWADGTTVQVDNHGKLSSFERGPANDSGAGELPAEQTRPLAEQALRDYFERRAVDLNFDRSTPEIWRNTSVMSHSWRDRGERHGIQQRYVVRFAGPRIVSLEKGSVLPVETKARDETISAWPTLPALAFDVFLVALGFSQRNLVEAGARWRVAMAAWTYVISFWFAWRFPMPFETSVRILMAATVALTFSLVTYFVQVAAERAARRIAPYSYVNLSGLFGRAVFSEPCGLAILRGTLIGLAILGVDTSLVWFGTAQRLFRLEDSFHVTLQSHWYLSSPFSSVHLLLACGFAATVLTEVAFFASTMARWIPQRWLALIAAAALTALLFPGAIFALGAIAPYPWRVAVLMVDLLILNWAFLRYDVLTLAWAALTFAFCWENYELLVILAPGGNVEPMIAFAIAALVVVTAAAVTFQAALRRARMRLASAFE